MNFIEQAIRTESPNLPLPNEQNSRLLHSAIGCATEAGELLDALKKSLFYGKPLDLINVREEFGDLLWYIAIGLDALDTTFEAEMDRVIRKLRVRYPEKFSEELAENRDLFGEREQLMRCRHDVPFGEDCPHCEADFRALTEG